MAFRSLTLLLDDIATVLDDVALLTKAATKKTAGVLGDDLALNAQQVAGVRAARELPVVWAVAKGSFRNKLFIVPVALIFSAFTPWLITPLLMIGGAYLCFEGSEKLAHRFLHTSDADDQRHALPDDPDIDLVALERDKIKGAIRTDFILSIEIIVITLGTVAAAPFVSQLTVLIGIAVIITVGVYGLVAGIVKLDDGGLYLTMAKGHNLLSRARRRLGRFVLVAAPYLMKGLSIAGTAAMFTVGGGIIIHGIGALEGLRHDATLAVGNHPSIGVTLETLSPILFDAAAGLVFGFVIFGVITLINWLRRALIPA